MTLPILTISLVHFLLKRENVLFELRSENWVDETEVVFTLLDSWPCSLYSSQVCSCLVPLCVKIGQACAADLGSRDNSRQLVSALVSGQTRRQFTYTSGRFVHESFSIPTIRLRLKLFRLLVVSPTVASFTPQVISPAVILPASQVVSPTFSFPTSQSVSL